MDKNLQIILAVLFLILLLCSIGSFIFGIVRSIQYQKARSNGIPSKFLGAMKTEMIATLLIGIIGVIIFGSLLYLIFRDNTKSFNTKFIMFFVVLITLLFLASIGSIAYGGYMIVMSKHSWPRELGDERKKIGSICLGVGIPGFIIFGLLFIKFALRNGIKYIVS